MDLLHNHATHALEALLQNPVQFVPATDATYEDQKKIAPKLRPLVMDDVSHNSPEHRSFSPSVRQEPVSRLQARSEVVAHAISGRWIRQSSGPIPSRGFFNRHVMCYRNSMVQALMHTPKLVNWLEYHHPICAQDNRCTACALKKLSLQYWHASSTAEDVNRMMNSLESNLRKTSAFATWSWRRQQDANEYYLHLINSIIERHPR